MERSIVIAGYGNMLSRLFIPEEFSVRGQSMKVTPLRKGVKITITAADGKLLAKAERSARTTAAVFEKMREVSNGN